MAQEIKNISPSELLDETKRLKDDGYRLVAISSVNKDGLELSYSFDKDYDLINLRLNISHDDEIESITGIYPFAFLYENEIKELFSVKITNISLDFNDSLYMTSIRAPFYTEASKENDNGK